MAELAVTHGRRRKRLKSKTRAFKVLKSLPKSVQSVWNTPKSVSEPKIGKNPLRKKKMVQKLKCKNGIKILIQRTSWTTLNQSIAWSMRSTFMTFHFFHFFICWAMWIMVIPKQNQTHSIFRCFCYITLFLCTCCARNCCSRPLYMLCILPKLKYFIFLRTTSHI